VQESNSAIEGIVIKKYNHSLILRVIEVWTDTICIFHMELIFFIPSASNDINIIPSSILPCSNQATRVKPTYPYKLRLHIATPSVIYLHR